MHEWLDVCAGHFGRRVDVGDEPDHRDAGLGRRGRNGGHNAHEPDRVVGIRVRHCADRESDQRSGACGLQRQLDIVSRQIAGQQKVAFGAALIEHFLAGQGAKVLLQFLLGPLSLTAGSDGGDPGIDHFHPDLTVLDLLREHPLDPVAAHGVEQPVDQLLLVRVDRLAGRLRAAA